MSFCANCGTQAAAGAPFCSGCGRPLPQPTTTDTAMSTGRVPAAAVADPAVARSTGPGSTGPGSTGPGSTETAAPPTSVPLQRTPETPPSATTPTPTPTHTPTPPPQAVHSPAPTAGVQAPLVVPTPPPPGGVPAPRPPGGPRRKNKAALIAGAVAAVVAVVAVVFVALPEPAPQAPPPPPPPPTEPVTPQSPTTPASSSLKELIPTQVGSFTLVQIQPIPQAVSAGALEAYDAVYQGPNGSSIEHVVAAWPDAATAESFATGFGDSLAQDQGLARADSGTFTDESGQPLGFYVFYTDGQAGLLAWSNDQIGALALGAADDLPGFFEALPY